MNASKARRRWIRWCRYIQKTNSIPAGSKQWIVEIHVGQAKAYGDAMYAGRYAPIGVRSIWYPRWGDARRG